MSVTNNAYWVEIDKQHLEKQFIPLFTQTVLWYLYIFVLIGIEAQGQL